MKWYEAPMVETVELEAKVSLLAGSDEETVDPGDWEVPVPGDE